MSPFAPSVPAALLSALLLAPSALPQLRDADGTVSASPLGSAGQPAVQTNVEDELYQMSSQAGVIFAGQVLAVRPQLDLAYGSSSGWVEIEFRVDQAIRGCVGEATYVLREWSGLWSGGRQRYSVGQQLLMLLHTPGASGLSSPVGGQDGAIPLTGAGASPRPQDRFATATEQAVDLRWIEARLLRSSLAGSHPTVHPGIVAHLQPASVSHDRSPITTKATRALRSVSSSRLAGTVSSAGFESPITVPLSGTASQGISLRSVLSMFQAWQAEQSNGTH